MTKLTVIRTKHNPEQTYEEFKAARLDGFGGSDIGSLLNEGDYSCHRRLFLERLGLMPEEEDRLKFHVERGKFFEGPVAELYSHRTGRTVKQVGSGYIGELPFIRANADRVVWNDDTHGILGVLEIKVPGEHSFRKIKKEGLPQAYILQLQWQMLCYGTRWGSFAIYWADGHELLWFDVERDEELIKNLIEKAKKEWERLEFWKQSLKETPREASELFEKISLKVGIFPKALDSHAKACERCPAHEACHGISFNNDGVVIEQPNLEVKAAYFLKIKSEIKALEGVEKDLKAEMRAAFKDFPCDYIKAGKYKIKISERSRSGISSEKMKQFLSSDQLASCMTQTSYEVVDVKEIKE